MPATRVYIGEWFQDKGRDLHFCSSPIRNPEHSVANYSQQMLTTPWAEHSALNRQSDRHIHVNECNMSLKIPLHSYLDFSPANVTDVSDEHGEKVYYHNISTMGKHDLGELNPNMLLTTASSFREKLQKFTRGNHWNIFGTTKVNVFSSFHT